MTTYSVEPVGTIYSPYKKLEDIPRQGTFKKEIQAKIVLDPKWSEAMMGLEKFRTLVLLFLFHRSEEVHLVEDRPWLGGKRGVFGTRSPNRPNHIGMTEVEVISIDGCEITFKGPDMLDGTPIIDIKPSIKELKLD